MAGEVFHQKLEGGVSGQTDFAGERVYSRGGAPLP